MYTLAKPLFPGDRLAVVAPSAVLGGSDPEEGIAFLRSLGFRVSLGWSVSSAWGYLAGSDEVRAQDINDAFADDDIDGIICLRGGYGATRILHLLDYDLIEKHPKVFIGFSDITALHTVFLQRCHMATVHGPMVMSLPKASDYTKRSFAAGLHAPFAAGPVILPAECPLETIVAGCAEGTLCGGNMMLLSVMTGTPYELDGTGAVIFLEEVGEDAYAVDRMLRQFEQSGLPKRASAFIFGEFFRCEPNECQPYEFTVKEIIFQYARRWGKPAVWGFPAGHGAHNAWIPFGMTARVSCGEKVSVEIVSALSK